MSESQYLKPADVAKLLQVSRPQVMTLVRTKGLPVIQLSKRLFRFERAAVIAWVEEQKQLQKGAA